MRNLKKRRKKKKGYKYKFSRHSKDDKQNYEYSYANKFENLKDISVKFMLNK